MWVTSSLANTKTPTAIALGNFDGIHLGHQKVLRPILEANLAREAIKRPIPTVVTFHPHPKAFFAGEDRLLLTPLSEKVELLSQLGIRQLIRLPFDHALANLSPQAFVSDILVQSLQSQFISVGADFCFGYQRTGTAEELKAIAQSFGIDVTINPLLTQNNDDNPSDRISSSRIRQTLASGDLATVTQMLGRPYGLQGKVVEGQKLGRTLGFPTANLQLPPDKFLPRWGVYAVHVEIEEPLTFPSRQEGVMNLGLRPTVDGQTITAEVHLLDWGGDLYGKPLRVSLESFIRPEQRFSSLEALKEQIYQDCCQAQKFFRP